MKAARIAKWRETETQEQTSSPKAQNPAHPQTDKVTFVWDGSRLLQEIHPDRTHTYIYTEADSYEPLAQITNYTDPDKAQQIHYFHCDQIGIPRAMSDEAGNIVWRGQYDAWGKLLHEEKADGIHQPFRLQNQYYDQETGLYYNFFRYYDPTVGRFTQQDPIGLLGGDNLYWFAPNVQMWVDQSGLNSLAACSNPANAAACAEAGIIRAAPKVRLPSQPLVVPNSCVPGSKCDEDDEYEPCRGKRKYRMRHFTNSKGIQGIKTLNLIFASDQNKVFAVLAKGKPLSPHDFEVTYGVRRGRGNHYVEFDTCDGEFIPRKNTVNGKTVIEYTHDGAFGLYKRNPTYHRNR